MLLVRSSSPFLDWRRNAVFCVFGSVYLGGFQYWLMINKFKVWFPTATSFASKSLAMKLKDKAGLLDAAKMVVFDICIHMPLMYFPSFYFCKEAVFGDSLNPVDMARSGVTKYYGNAKEDVTAMVKLWLPADCVQFMLPMHVRLPFRHIVSFFWTAYVSFTRGSK